MKARIQAVIGSIQRPSIA